MGKLHFYQLSEELPDPSDSMVEGDTTPTLEIPELIFSKDATKIEDLHDQSPKGLFTVLFLCTCLY